MAKKRPLLSPQARPRLLVSIVLKSDEARAHIQKILREGREKDLTRQQMQARLFNEVLRDAGLQLMRSEKGQAQGITFSPTDGIKAAARLLRMGYRLDGASSRLRCPNRTGANRCE